MKTLVAVALCVMLFPVSALTQSAKTEKTAEAALTEDQKTLYALGVWLAQKADVFSLTATDLKFVQMGIKDAVLGRKPQADLAVYGPKLNDLAQARIKVKADKEKQKAKAFLDKMAKETGAQKSPSGLIYFEVKTGTGAAPSPTDTVRAYYQGTLVDGTVFDASSRHGSAPLEFALNGVIPCWTEGIQKMKVGGKAKLVCPSDIAYGDRGTGGIPGGATLIFEVELAGVVKNEAAAPAPAPRPVKAPTK